MLALLQDRRRELGQAVLVAEGPGQGQGRAVGAAAGELDDDGLAVQAVGNLGHLVRQQGAGLGLDGRGDLLAQGRGQPAQHGLAAGPHAGLVDAVEQPQRRRPGRRPAPGQDVLVVLVHQLDQGQPVDRVAERQGRRDEERALVAAAGQLVADPAHDVHVGEVVQLHRVADAELVMALLGGEAGQVAAGFGLAAGGQGQQQQDVDMLRHGRSFPGDSCAIFAQQAKYSPWGAKGQVPGRRWRSRAFAA